MGEFREIQTRCLGLGVLMLLRLQVEVFSTREQIHLISMSLNIDQIILLTAIRNGYRASSAAFSRFNNLENGFSFWLVLLIGVVNHVRI